MKMRIRPGDEIRFSREPFSRVEHPIICGSEINHTGNTPYQRYPRRGLIVDGTRATRGETLFTNLLSAGHRQRAKRKHKNTKTMNNRNLQREGLEIARHDDDHNTTMQKQAIPRYSFDSE